LVRRALSQGQSQIGPRSHHRPDRERSQQASLPSRSDDRIVRAASGQDADAFEAAADGNGDEEEIAEDFPVDDETAELSAQFVLEAHLEEFLAGNWSSIDWGRPLEIWTSPGRESGHQFNTPAERLDFLCADQSANALVIVELKRGRP
jgi:hypothetical protein